MCGRILSYIIVNQFMPKKYESTLSVKITYQLNRLNLNVQLKCVLKINALPIGICSHIIFLYQVIPECYSLMRLILTIHTSILGHRLFGFGTEPSGIHPHAFKHLKFNCN